ncbi:alpha/beta hydrolase [Acetobacterium woodii]|uniref:Alpha/beta hydrolase fold-3 domain protein n=1 Tax=Acetobacterium woodii (strain ATCC 29683 / DSM 1030 / JCM 2381 / KCTC 1655 / WB1) TaxID=931626 RepID=H6LG71_ACEWD|nr:alpha/beta hydrolase [Acetobacterium woodii]AFA49547.1 alpha/beta hydrolase fold-3 domain protein [Acetobacterium woodii DSM 1030]
MSSKAKMMHLMMKYRHLFKGKLRREVIDENTSVVKLRQDCDDAAARFFKPVAGIKYITADYEELYAEWVELENASQDKVVLYFHGGGFIMGNAISHRNIVSNFVKRLGIKALVFNYRLAPEHPAPAAVYDSVDIYNWLLKQGYLPNNIIFAGDSAGGGIALATLLKCKDDGIPLPAVCAVFSPCTDMTISGESHKTRVKADPCTPKGSTETYLGYYIGNGDPQHPYTSPLFGDLTGLPPMIIQVGNNETLRDDSTRFAQKAKEAGGEVQIKVWNGMFHCFPLLAPMFPEATAALEEVCQFIRINLKS